MAQQPLTVYLVRHGEPLWDREGRVQGQTDSPLSELGMRQTSLLLARFAEVPLTAVGSSPLQLRRAGHYCW